MTGDLTKTILIGVGNGFRQDDGVGIFIARRLRAQLPASMTVTETSGESAELMTAWEGYDRVYLFDAVMSRGTPGKVHRLQAHEQRIPPDFFKHSSHAFSLAEAVDLARRLDRLPNDLVVFGVEGLSFDYGDELTPVVIVAAQDVVERVLDELNAKPQQ